MIRSIKKREMTKDYNKSVKVSKFDETSNEDEKKNPIDFSNNLFVGLNVFILPVAIGNTRFKILRDQLVKFGGNFVQEYRESSEITHIVVDENMEMDQICRLLKVASIPNYIKVVKSLWLSTCFKNKSLTNIELYELKSNKNDTSLEKRESLPSTSAIIGEMDGVRKKDETSVESEYQTSDDDDEALNFTQVFSKSSPEKQTLLKGHFVCAIPSTQVPVSPNKYIIDKLEILANSYKTDKWRSLGYTKAINALKNHPNEISSWEEANSINGIGSRIADKIWEIVQFGHLRKIDEVCSGDRATALNLFSDVWGAGATTAEMWVQQGFCTLDDLREKANLNRQQKIGLTHFYDFLERMPRDEATEIEKTVKDNALVVQSGLIVMACGSYRRGNTTCGDVDVLITHPDGKSHKGVFQKLLEALHESGFITDDLVTQQDNGSQRKYLGVCKLPGENTKHRRLDIIVVPYHEYACALMYFTGSAHFNRSMRLLAQKMGMSLSEHSLNAGVVRKGKEKLNNGYILPTPTEETIFKHLGLEFRPPCERNH